MTLRESIEARRAALLSERAIAEAAAGAVWTAQYDFIYADDAEGKWRILRPMNAGTDYDLAHAAAQDPAATIARVDRELAGIDADLLLLAFAESWADAPSSVARRGSGEALTNLNARYPEDDQ